MMWPTRIKLILLKLLLLPFLSCTNSDLFPEWLCDGTQGLSNSFCVYSYETGEANTYFLASSSGIIWGSPDGLRYEEIVPDWGD